MLTRSNHSADAIKFISLIEGFGFTQLVTENTHDKGHCLDLVLVRRENSAFVSNVKTDITGLSDHSAVSSSLTVPRPPIKYRKIVFGRMKAINSEELIYSVASAFAGEAYQGRDIDFVAKSYNIVLTNGFDDLAPKITKTVVHRPDMKFYNSAIRQAKVVCRRSEKLWWKEKLTVYRRDAYRDARRAVSNLIRKTKSEYYKDCITKCGNNQRELFQLINKMMQTSINRS